ncbi:MAG: STAS domain-containing protein [Armatimonadetes bacterium]|nr:STAS domain-containing protein [Armatimonadota bacterium]
MDFGVSSERPSPAIGLVSVTGEIDVYTSPRVRSAMLEHFEAGCTSLVVDLSSVDYLDSSGLGILVAGLKRARELGGEVLLVTTKPRIMRVLEVTGLDKVFNISATMDEALQKTERK